VRVIRNQVAKQVDALVELMASNVLKVVDAMKTCVRTWMILFNRETSQCTANVVKKLLVRHHGASASQVILNAIKTFVKTLETVCLKGKRNRNKKRIIHSN
jgi:hypothetical protein